MNRDPYATTSGLPREDLCIDPKLVNGSNLPYRVIYTKGDGKLSLASLETFQSLARVELTLDYMLRNGGVITASLPDGTHVTIEPNK